MSSLKTDINEEWKVSLQSNLVTCFNGTEQEKEEVLEAIGYCYMCCAPASLYKYYSDKKENLDAVKNNKMWYSAPHNFNDVFDCDIVIDENAVFESALELLPGGKTVRKGSRMWKDIKKTVSAEVKNLRVEFDKLRKSTGISCLSELDNSLLMWAHYANNHCGICVEYELIKINEELGFTTVPIIYSDNRMSFSSIDPKMIDEDTTRIFIESLTTKSTEWCYEKEWRIIQDDVACGDKWDDEKRGALLEMISPSSITMGCMIKPEFEQEVYRYCNNSKINLFKMQKDKSRYILNKYAVLNFDE